MEPSISANEQVLYDCVQSLIADDPRAKALYLQQDEQQQGKIILHAASICSYEQLQDFLRI